MKSKTLALNCKFFILVILLFSGLNISHARDYIRIVGSSTVYPFATVVAERFGEKTNFKTPIIESTGTGGGLKLFCAGIGDTYPDIANASRRIKLSEIEFCTENNASKILEFKIGYDGIVLVNHIDAEHLSVSLKEIYLALAKWVPSESGELIPNPYEYWSEINDSLPHNRIEVLGPPPTSGTRDAFVEMAMEGGALEFESMRSLKKMKKVDEESAKKMGLKQILGAKASKSDGSSLFKIISHTMREDGAFIEAGENDNLVIQKIIKNKNAIGIVGYSFLDQNLDSIQSLTVDEVDPEYDNISSGSYSLARSLYFYVKMDHMSQVLGLEEYVSFFAHEDTSGEEGFLSDRGLIALGYEEMNKRNKNVLKKQSIDLSQF